MVLTQGNYFSKEAQSEHMSVSQYKSFLRCEAAALAEIKGDFTPEKSDALIQGSYVDAYFEGTLNIFKQNHPELYKKDGTLLAKYEHLNYIIYRIEQQPFLIKLLSGEKQKIMTGIINGVPVKIKIDSFLQNMIVDLKCMRDFADIYVDEQGRLPWYEAWGYDIQGAVYQEIVYQNTGKKLPFVLVAATKEIEPDLTCIQLPQSSLDYELEKFSENIQRFDAIKKGIIVPERCEKCDYCKKTKIIKEICVLEENEYD